MKTITFQLILLGTVAATGLVVAQEPKKDEAAKIPKGKFTISKETTYVTGPRDKDGYIDYMVALNERLKRGVTPENNANVLLWKAMGPRPDGAKMPAEFFKWMDIEPPPEKGEYFLPFRDFAKTHLGANFDSEAEKYELLMRECGQRPWSAKEYPWLGEWLKSNKKPLALVMEATKKTRYYSPVVPEKGKHGESDLLACRVNGVHVCRSFVSALAARAMLQTNDGELEAAWLDLMASHRLSRLVAHGCTIVDALVGLSGERITCHAELAFVAHRKLDSQRIATFLSELRSLAAAPAVADKVDLFERCVLLNTIMLVDRHGIDYLEVLCGGHPAQEGSLLSSIKKATVDGVEWDPALRSINRSHDNLSAAMREADPVVRYQKLNDFQNEFRKQRAETATRESLSLLMTGKPNERGKVIGDLIIALMSPSALRLRQIEDRAAQSHANVLLAFALVAYRADHGKYPQDLIALAPKYLPQVPQDLFSGKPLIYRLTDEGYLLYSVGPNLQDDGGRGPDDEPPGDDIAVRMPLPEPKNK